MTIGTFDASAQVVEQDTTRIIGPEEQSLYSIVDHLRSRLNALGWTLEVLPDTGGWPDYDSLKVPSVYVNLDTVTTAGVELGSDGSRALCLVTVYGANDAQRFRLAGLIRKIFDRTIPLFSYTTGNEDNPTPTGEYFITDSVGWRKLPSPYNESDKQQYRALITATLRRVE
jgi:hypothetical protein